ncbi:hypothetical protein AAY473_018646, partial [Plecturocebus cupreus]
MPCRARAGRSGGVDRHVELSAHGGSQAGYLYECQLGLSVSSPRAHPQLAAPRPGTSIPGTSLPLGRIHRNAELPSPCPALLPLGLRGRVACGPVAGPGSRARPPPSFRRSRGVSPRQGLTLSPRLQCSGTSMAHCSHDLLGSSNSPASAPQVAGTTAICHHTQIILVFFGREQVLPYCPGWSQLLSQSTSLGLP